DGAAAGCGRGRPEDGGDGGGAAAVHPAGGHHQVGAAGQSGRFRRLGAEPQVDAEGAAAGVQDLQQPVPAEGGEAVAARGVAGAAVHDVDVVPADEVPAQRRVDVRVGVFDAAEGLVGEDDAEPEGGGGGVAVEDGE